MPALHPLPAIDTRLADDHDHDHDHDRGLAHDLAVLARMLPRRRALAWLGAGGGAALLGCGGGDGGSTTASTESATTTTTTTTATTGTTGTTTSGGSVGTCAVVPEETQGPYPGDGSNGPNALSLSGIVRSDIRSSFGSASAVAAGVPLTLTLRLVNTASACADLSGYAIYVWHCDREGRYSLYASGVTDQNYLRGVQPTGSDGSVSFTTVFPGCYAGRMPHIHFEVYRSTTTATSFSNKLRTSQVALPEDVCSAVYAGASGYAASAANLATMSYATDLVFSDGVALQLATVSGSVAEGYAAELVVGISV
jgi:protocatechuate 3,4-dioxygenase beta subunit